MMTAARTLLIAASRPAFLAVAPTKVAATAVGVSVASRFIATMSRNDNDKHRRTMAYVYTGPGASLRGVNRIVSLLQSSAHLGVQTLGIEDIVPRYTSSDHDTSTLAPPPPHWTDDGAVLIMPGGRDYAFYFNHQQTQTIRDFVYNGGSYLGMCAGAYYGSSRCLFEGHQVATSSQHLGFFQGDAVGAITPELYERGSEKGAASVEVVWNPYFVSRCKAAGEPTPDQKPYRMAYAPVALDVYANGGCCFVHPQNYRSNDNELKHHHSPQDSQFEVLAVYGGDQGLRQDAEGRAAIISCSYGKGKVVLSGVHPEITAQDAWMGAQADRHTKNILLSSQAHYGASSLREEDDCYRAALFRSLLRECTFPDNLRFFTAIPHQNLKTTTDLR